MKVIKRENVGNQTKRLGEKARTKIGKKITLEGFGKHISGVFLPTHKFQLKLTLIVLLPNIVVAHIDVLRMSMERSVTGQKMGAEAVPIENRLVTGIGNP